MGLAALEGPQKNVWTPSICHRPGRLAPPRPGGHHCLGHRAANPAIAADRVLCCSWVYFWVATGRYYWSCLGSTLGLQCFIDLSIWTLYSEFAIPFPWWPLTFSLCLLSLLWTYWITPFWLLRCDIGICNANGNFDLQFLLGCGSLLLHVVLDVLVVEQLLYTYCLHMLGKFANAIGPLRFGSFVYFGYNFALQFWSWILRFDVMRRLHPQQPLFVF